MADEPSPPSTGADRNTISAPSAADVAEGGCTCKGRLNLRRLMLTAVFGALAAGGAVWLQKTLWPKRAHPPAARQQTPEREVKFDWENPPLPPRTRVDVPLRRGSVREGNMRLQLLCSSALSVQEVLAFYDAELAKEGWKNYNGPGIPTGEIAGRMYAAGNLSMAVHVMPEEGGGSALRLSVLMRPAALPGPYRPDAAPGVAPGAP